MSPLATHTATEKLFRRSQVQDSVPLACSCRGSAPWIPSLVDVREVVLNLTGLGETPCTVSILEPAQERYLPHRRKLFGRVVPIRWDQSEEEIICNSARTEDHRMRNVPHRRSWSDAIEIGMRIKVANALQRLTEIKSEVFAVLFEPLKHASPLRLRKSRQIDS